MFQEKLRPFKVDEEKGDQMHTTCQTIDTRWGSDNHPHYSHGNTLPYTGVPFGMNYFLPQTTDEQGAWFFNPNLPIFQGFRLTHQPSPWI